MLIEPYRELSESPVICSTISPYLSLKPKGVCMRQVSEKGIDFLFKIWSCFVKHSTLQKPLPTSDFIFDIASNVNDRAAFVAIQSLSVCLWYDPLQVLEWINICRASVAESGLRTPMLETGPWTVWRSAGWLWGACIPSTGIYAPQHISI